MTPPIEFDLSIDSVDGAKKITGKLTENEGGYLLDALQSSASAGENSSQGKESNESFVQDSSENIEEDRVMTDFIDFSDKKADASIYNSGWQQDGFTKFLNKKVKPHVIDYIKEIDIDDSIINNQEKKDAVEYRISKLFSVYKENDIKDLGEAYYDLEYKLEEDSSSMAGKLLDLLESKIDKDVFDFIDKGLRPLASVFERDLKDKTINEGNMENNIFKRIYYGAGSTKFNAGDQLKDIMDGSDEEIKKAVSIAYLHDPHNGHLYNKIKYLKSQPDFQENLFLDYANWLGVPKELQFDIEKDVVVDGQNIKIIAKGFFTKKDFIDGKYIVGEKEGKKCFVFDSTMSEHKFIAEKYGIDKVWGGGWVSINKKESFIDQFTGVKVSEKSKFYGEDPYQESGFTKRVFENLLNK